MHTNRGNKFFYVIMRRHRTTTPAYPKRSGFMDTGHSGTLRCGQALSGALRYAQVLSKTLCFNLGPTVFNNPNGSKAGCSPSIPVFQSTSFTRRATFFQLSSVLVTRISLFL